MFSHDHFLFARTEFITIVSSPSHNRNASATTLSGMNHPGRFKPGAVLNGESLVRGLDSIDVYLLINARLGKIRRARRFVSPAHKSNLPRWRVRAGQALKRRFSSWGPFQKTTGMIGVRGEVVLINRDRRLSLRVKIRCLLSGGKRRR